MSDDTRRRINGHTLVLSECDWRCLQCQHSFDAANDANAHWCGEPCTCLAYLDARVAADRSVPVGPTKEGKQ